MKNAYLWGRRRCLQRAPLTSGGWAIVRGLGLAPKTGVLVTGSYYASRVSQASARGGCFPGCAFDGNIVAAPPRRLQHGTEQMIAHKYEPFI